MCDIRQRTKKNEIGQNETNWKSKFDNERNSNKANDTDYHHVLIFT